MPTIKQHIEFRDISLIQTKAEQELISRKSSDEYEAALREFIKAAAKLKRFM